MSAESFVAVVKLEVLVHGLKSWIPTDGALVIVWLNSWLAPHWVVTPIDSSIHIQRHGVSKYLGPLSGFPDCHAAFHHGVEMKMCETETQSVIYGLAFELDHLLRRTWGQLGPIEMQVAVQDFFQQRRHH